MTTSKEYIVELLNSLDVRVNGDRDWDIKVLNENFYDRVIAERSLGLGESYMDGWWECKSLDQFFYKIFIGEIEKKVKPNLSLLLHYVKGSVFNFQDKVRSKKVAREHYDIGNDIYESILGSTMAYSCGYWKNANILDEAQNNKLDLICRKLKLEPGMTVLDIGCGFGSLMKYMAGHYKVKCVGITLSKEQIAFGENFCKGLPVEFRLQDYRDINEKFDRVVSVGMFEHVGPKNYKEFMKVSSQNLKDEGIFLLHTIGRSTSVTATDPWMDKYIFPGGVIPSIKQIGKSMEGIFVMEDWHNFGQYYDPTLMAWYEKFEKAWPTLKEKYGERFYKMWKFYLLSCAALFRSRDAQLWQIVMTKRGIVGGYESVR